MCAVLVVIPVVVLPVGIIDDAYIFLRYADNIAQGHGPVFNVGERVEGYSSPLWTFLLGAGGAVFGRLELLAQLACVLCALGALAVVWRGIDPADNWMRRIVVLAMATSPLVFFAAGSGMDSALFTMLVAASLVAAMDDLHTRVVSPRTTALLILTTLARTEGVLLAALVGAFWIVDRLIPRRDPRSPTPPPTRSIIAMSTYALIVVALLCLRFAYYDSWVPNTAYAKVTFDLEHRVRNGIVYMFRAARVHAPLLLILAATAVLARHARDTLRRRLLLLGSWITLYTAYVVYIGGDNIPALRFMLPVAPAVCLFISHAWPLIAERLSIPHRRAAIATFAAAFAISNVCTYINAAPSYFGEMKLARAWSNVGRWLAENTPPDAVIATCVPGAMAYHSKRTTIDMLGLTDREVAMHGQVHPQGGHGHARFHTDYIFERDPDLVIYHSSGRFGHPVCTNPGKIDRFDSNALYDFVTDVRCAARYEYSTDVLSDETYVEMQRKRTDRNRVAEAHCPP